MLRFFAILLLGAYCLAAPILGFTSGINFERDHVPVCYAPTEDSDPIGCHYDGKRDVWLRNPITPDSVVARP